MSQQDIQDKAQTLLREGWNAAKRSDWAGAEQSFADALQLGGQLDPAESDVPVMAMLAMAQVSYERGKKEEAIERATSAYALSAETENFSGWQFPLYELMANLFDEMGAPERAVPFRNTLARLWKELEGGESQKTARACALLGESLTRLGLAEHAALAFGEAANADASYLPAWADALRGTGRYQEAESVYRRLLDAERDNSVRRSEALGGLGALCCDTGRLEESVRFFFEAYRIQLARGVPAEARAQVKARWAVALARLGRLDEAEKVALESLELWGDSPESFQAHGSLAEIAEARGDIRGAESHLSEALRLMEARGVRDLTRRIQFAERHAALLDRLGRVEEASAARAKSAGIAAARRRAPDAEALFGKGSVPERD